MAEKKLTRFIDIVRIKNQSRMKLNDEVIDEQILKMIINNERAFEMVFSMTDTEDLAAGFLYTQSIVHQKSDIKDIQFNPLSKECRINLVEAAYQRLIAFKKTSQVKGSSGGSLLQRKTDLHPSIHHSSVRLMPDQVFKLMQTHFDHSILFQQTGAVHSAGLCTENEILYYFEDIGRHNALDKLAGRILLKGLDTKNMIVTLSCRMSLEIIGKIIKTGIPVVISNAAPTVPAVELAEKSGLTMIGFARDRRFNVYTHTSRVCL